MAKIKFKKALLLALLSAGCSSSTTTSSKGDNKQQEVDNLSPEERVQFQAQELKEELEIGRSMAAKLAGTKGVVKGKNTTVQYLNLITQTLARQAGRPEIDFSVALIKDSEPNAFATPGGFIFVTEGLLSQVKDEDELAGVLAHEIAHITEKHLFNEIRPKRKVSAGESISRMMSRGGSNLGQGLSKMVNQGIKSLIEDGLGQQKESAADHVGVMYAVAAGYDPMGLHRFLNRIASSQKELKLGKTHPPFDERIKLFNEFIQQQQLQKVPSASNKKILESRFKKGMGQA